MEAKDNNLKALEIMNSLSFAAKDTRLVEDEAIVIMIIRFGFGEGIFGYNAFEGVCEKESISVY